MADFVAVLRKTLDGMGETTPATRERVYEKARATVAAKLAAINPPPPPSVADRQRRALEDAIASIEKEYAANSDPLSELEDVFASLKNPQPKVLEQPVVKTGAWPKVTPAPAAPRPAAPVARQAAVPPASRAHSRRLPRSRRPVDLVRMTRLKTSSVTGPTPCASAALGRCSSRQSCSRSSPAAATASGSTAMPSATCSASAVGREIAGTTPSESDAGVGNAGG